MTVLVVDSSVQIIERLQHLLLETENIAVAYGAVSSKDAAMFFNKNKTDVVLLDGGLPGNMSVDLVHEIKTTDANTTVIILANSNDFYVRAKYKLHGADFFIDKYHDFEKIGEVIDYIVSKKNLNPSNEKSKYYSAIA
ncbi:response regulator [Ferruginibacter sp.]|nr:response regulator [Ferruginibacter sp.]